MNTNTISGKLLEVRGSVKVQLSKLTNSRRLYIDGKKDELIGKALKQYGKLKDLFNGSLKKVMA